MKKAAKPTIEGNGFISITKVGPLKRSNLNLLGLILLFLIPLSSFGQDTDRELYIDVHELEPGSATLADVEAAHKKDLAIQDQHDVEFIKFWINEAEGKIYCLSEAKGPHGIYATHKEAHGLVPARILKVSEGHEAALTGGRLFLDIHRLEPGSVTAEAVAGAHKKDLAVQEKYGVNFINYWVDEKEGVIMCLSEAPDSTAVKMTHKEAHGLLPQKIMSVKVGH